MELGSWVYYRDTHVSIPYSYSRCTCNVFNCYGIYDIIWVISHYREGNVVLTIGGIVGGCGAFGSYIGSKIGSLIPPYLLHWFTAGMLFLSAIFMCIKLIKFQNEEEVRLVKIKDISKENIMKCICLGLVTGMMTGSFGIGSAPFIQLGLMVLLGLTIQQSVGTTMLVILPIAIGGGLGYSSEGYLDYILYYCKY